MMATSNNPYLTVVERNLPRILSLISMDNASKSYGMVDRRYWAWKTIDFPNASMQAIASGIARLAKQNNLSKEFSDVRFEELAVEIIKAIKPMISKSGGLSEAFPHEKSFCVTGQVLADMLDALNVLKSNLAKTEFENLLEILEPLAIYLLKNEESHAIISNHLATSALGLVRWANLTNNFNTLNRADYFLQIIHNHASSEGWFLEYLGADPGYQSWALSSLTQIYFESAGLVEDSLLENGFKFIAQFALNDGSFANGAGARLTSFLFSLGPELFSARNDIAKFLSIFSRKYVNTRSYVTLDSIDDSNLAQFFNDSVRSAEQFDKFPAIESGYQRPEMSIFSEAGLIAKHSEKSSILISAVRGGWTCVAEVDKKKLIYPQTVMKNLKDELFIADATRHFELVGNSVVIRAGIKKLKNHSPSIIKFIFLRIYILSFGKIKYFRELLKKILVRYLITQKTVKRGTLVRTIDFNSTLISDSVENCDLVIVNGMESSPYHMASYGYWTR